jgi:hypothetical protein
MNKAVRDEIFHKIRITAFDLRAMDGYDINRSRAGEASEPRNQ